MNLKFSLRAHAALILLQERDKLRRSAAGKTAVHAARSKSKATNSHSAGQLGRHFLKGLAKM
ncbi:hypothetical protein [Roseovarius aestuarii]|uniref:hypothetical protein n=1 Tax=Roseovarius aestuarii TaxID=475083 RepID=UPI00111C4DC2|nr:hypothetical protein [Roseovarius aestuarii]